MARNLARLIFDVDLYSKICGTESFFSSDTHQSMKTSESDLKVNRNIYPDAVNVLGCV